MEGIALKPRLDKVKSPSVIFLKIPLTSSVYKMYNVYMDTNKTVTIRIEQLNQDERRLIRSLTPAERKRILLEAARKQLGYMALVKQEKKR